MRVFKQEMKRALTGRGMLIAIIIGVICVAYKNIVHIKEFSDFYANIKGMDFYEPLNIETFYSQWIVGMVQPSTLYLYYILGLMVTIPFGASFYKDNKNGIIKNICTRTKKSTYIKAKYSAIFISGGIASSLPIFLDLLCAKLWKPYDVIDVMTTILGQGTRWDMFIIDHLYFAALLIIINWFVFGGAIATISLLVSSFIKDYFTVILTPFFIMLLLFYLPSFLPAKYNVIFPFYFLSIIGSSNPVYGIFISACILAITFTIFYNVESKRDIL